MENFEKFLRKKYRSQRFDGIPRIKVLDDLKNEINADNTRRKQKQ